MKRGTESLSSLPKVTQLVGSWDLNPCHLALAPVLLTIFLS